jgi:cytochrome c nitrite reductase small subunit
MPSDSLHRRRARVRSVGLAAVVLCVLLGIFLGAGGFTFAIARGGSYLSNDPAACVNCHIMREQYDSWQKSSHHAFATCNDCHVPHDFMGKYTTKATNGFRHSWGFTFQDFHEPIQLHESSKRVLQNNCLYCHNVFVSEITGHGNFETDAVNCIRCHSSVGHGANR